VTEGGPLLTSRELAARLGVVPETVRRWVRRGRLEPFGRTPTGQLRFHAAQLEGLLGPAERPCIEPRVSAAVQRSIDEIRRLREAG